MIPRIKSSLIVLLSASLILLVGASWSWPSRTASASPPADKAEMSKQAPFQAATRDACARFCGDSCEARPSQRPRAGAGAAQLASLISLGRGRPHLFLDATPERTTW